MKANLAQREPEMIEHWRSMNLYGRLRAMGNGRPRFVLHDGPPYANGHIHLGHTVNKVLKDIIVKSRQMMGFDAPYVPGWDCHGLPIEHNVEKELGARKREMTQMEIRKACRGYAEKFVRIQREEFERLGVLGEWDAPYLTMTYDYEASICREFCQIFLDGHVIKSKKPVYWCPTCVTALAEAEVEYAPHRSPSVTVKFTAGESLAQWVRDRFRTESPAHVLIWTTTPWTLPANLAVALHPDFNYVAAAVRGEVWLLAEGRLLPTLLAAGVEQAEIRILGRFRGGEVERRHVRHPFLDQESVLIVADYVTLDAGTGCVHTAPGHGAEDYESGLKYGLDIYSPVDERGHFTADVPGLGGEEIFEANGRIVKMLDERGKLVASETLDHSYPHCWRCKRPVIYRATAQWFISMEARGLRQEALTAIDTVQWIPAWGRERLRGMIEARPDWCVSRQRAWGVPVTVFVCARCGEPLMDREVADRIVEIFAKEGADAWFFRSAGEFLPSGTMCRHCSNGSFTKESDILDVWFDSGVSHAAVLEARPGLTSPADLYLEGSDQHRGWFQSSLLASVATRHRAPYRAVLTHGFVVDHQGKKMSKSVGNVIPPEDVIRKYGAEVLRLWVSAEDYQDDIKISMEILQRLTEAYRKIRNTVRYLLSNLSDFEPERDGVSIDRLEPLDRWALWRLGQLVSGVANGYQEFRFHSVFHQIHQFCTVDMSSLYLDIIKDRLYCELPNGGPRRSAQTVVYRIAEDMLRLMAPVLSFTAEEAWSHLPVPDAGRVPSVFLAEFPVPSAPALPEGFQEEWERLWTIRSEITKALELARQERRIGLALDARVSIRPPDALWDFVRGHIETLRTLTIVSQMEVVPDHGSDSGRDWHSDELPGLAVRVDAARGAKCPRCWTWSEDVTSGGGQGVCGRCARVLSELGMRPRGLS